MQFTQPTTAQPAPLVLSRHFSLKPSNTYMDESKFSVRTFKDGNKAIELVEQHTEAVEATLDKQAKQTVAPFTTFNFIRTVQHNIMMQAQGIFMSKEKKDDDDVPEGFQKFLKKARKGTKASKESDADKKGKGDEEKKAKEQKKDDDDLSELEEEAETKEKDGKKEGEKGQSDAGKKIKEFFFQPNGKDPKWENILLVAFLSGAFSYYLATMKPPSEEITYPEFINTYLAQNKCAMITISEDKSSDTFKFRAVIDTNEGKKVHMVLP